MAKLKNRFAEFAMNICGPVVIGEDGLRCEAYRSNLRAIYLGLQRYIDAQNKWNTYERALQEVRNGKKETHWVWFVFPQLYGLGSTPTAKFGSADIFGWWMPLIKNKGLPLSHEIRTTSSRHPSRCAYRQF